MSADSFGPEFPKVIHGIVVEVEPFNYNDGEYFKYNVVVILPILDGYGIYSREMTLYTFSETINLKRGDYFKGSFYPTSYSDDNEDKVYIFGLTDVEKTYPPVYWMTVQFIVIAYLFLGVKFRKKIFVLFRKAMVRKNFAQDTKQ